MKQRTASIFLAAILAVSLFTGTGFAFAVDELRTLTYNANGGTVFPESKSISSSSDGIGEHPVPVRDGYGFLGWYEDAAGTILASRNPPVIVGDICQQGIYFSSNKEVYAKWAVAERHVTLTYNANGGSVAQQKQEATLPYTQAGFSTHPVPIRSGYRFVGWYTLPAGGSLAGAGFSVNGETCTQQIDMPQDRTVYARWEEIPVTTITITYHANGGTVNGKSQIQQVKSLQTNVMYGTRPTAKKTGAKFLGWYPSKSGGVGIKRDTYLPAKSQQTLYAHYGNRYKIKFVVNGGKKLKKKARSKYVYGGMFVGKLPPKVLTKKMYKSPGDCGEKRKKKLKNGTYKLYYKFAGWFTKKKGGKLVSPITPMPHKNLTLYAHWTKGNQKYSQVSGDGIDRVADYTKQYVFSNNTGKYQWVSLADQGDIAVTNNLWEEMVSAYKTTPLLADDDFSGISAFVEGDGKDGFALGRRYLNGTFVPFAEQKYQKAYGKPKYGYRHQYSVYLYDDKRLIPR